MELDELANSSMARIIEDLSHKSETIFNGLVGNKDEFLNAIPESLFINYFLPKFLGNVDNPNWVLEWIGIAGTPSSEVRVFSDVTKETLYYVPPVLNLSNIIYANQGNSFDNIFTRYQMYNNNLPVEGTKFLNSELSRKRNETNNFIDKRFLDNWIYILQRYNYLPPEQTNANVPTSSPSDILDY